MSIPKVKRYENGKELVGQVDTPYEITWEAWQLLTDAEKEKRKWLITDVPSADGFITVENMKLLWTNPSPSASFASQNITLSSDDYDFLMILSSFATAGMNLLPTLIVEKTSGGGYFNYTDYANGSVKQYVRGLSLNSATSILIGNCSSNGSTSNGNFIPQKIYGFKKQTEIRFNALAQNVKATVDYSTDEHPIGTWIDGSTLYEKTVYFGALPNATTKTIAHNISNIAKIVSITGFASKNDLTTFPLPYTIDPLNQCVSLQASATSIIIYAGINRSDFTNTYVTLRYTKTA